MAKALKIMVMVVVAIIMLETVTGAREVLDWVNAHKGRPVPPGVQKKLDAYEFMKEYGYLTASPAKLTWGEFMRSVKAAQKMMKLDQNGKLDDATMAKMKEPRCGDPDGPVYTTDDADQPEIPSDPAKRFTTYGYDWAKKYTRHITWVLYNTSEYLTDMEARWAINESYANWAQHTSLIFNPTICAQQPDTEIYFSYLSIGKLGVSWWPQNHKILFNTQHDFQVPPSTKAYQIVTVATHEIGHQLGLLHSDQSDAVMYAWYSGALTLSADDIAGIQSIYGGPDDVYATDEGEPESCLPDWAKTQIPIPT